MCLTACIIYPFSKVTYILTLPFSLEQFLRAIILYDSDPPAEGFLGFRFPKWKCLQISSWAFCEFCETLQVSLGKSLMKAPLAECFVYPGRKLLANVTKIHFEVYKFTDLIWYQINSILDWQNSALQLLFAHLWCLSFPRGSDGKECACSAGDRARSPGREDSLEKKMTTHSSILAWRIPWTEEPGVAKS